MSFRTSETLKVNLTVLRRHDKSISKIVDGASFVVLYEHVNDEWNKVGIEGTMFIFERNRTHPSPYGIFILNRNGTNNFSYDLVDPEDLELTKDFIILRSRNNDNTVYGIWIFEEKVRPRIGKSLDSLSHKAKRKLHQAFPAPPTTTELLNRGTSISIDDLFDSVTATTAKNTINTTTNNNSQQLQQQQVHQQQSQPIAAPISSDTKEGQALSGLALLDSMFKAASLSSGNTNHYNNNNNNEPSSSPSTNHSEKPEEQQQNSTTTNATSNANGNALLAMLDKSSKQEPVQSPPQEHKKEPVTGNDLLALLDKASRNYKQESNNQQAQPQVQSPPQQQRQQQQHQLPAQTLATAASIAPSTQPQSQSKQTLPQNLTTQEAQTILQSSIADHQLQQSKTLERNEFVRQLLTLIHTDPKFVDSLYQGHLHMRQGQKESINGVRY